MSLLLQSYDRMGVLLDPKTGRPKLEPPFDRPGVLRAWGNGADPDWHSRLPTHVKLNLDRGRELAGPFEPRASALGWEEVLYTPQADGVAVTAAAETIMVPDFSIPAGYLQPGKILKYTLLGRVSTAITTPGVITYRLRWGGVAGVVQAASAGLIPDVTAAATNLSYMIEWFLQCRTAGVAGTSLTIGRIDHPDPNDVDITNFVIEYNKRMAPASAPATAVTNTTIDSLLSPTVANTAATGSNTTHIAILEALN